MCTLQNLDAFHKILNDHANVTALRTSIKGGKLLEEKSFCASIDHCLASDASTIHIHIAVISLGVSKPSCPLTCFV